MSKVSGYPMMFLALSTMNYNRKKYKNQNENLTTSLIMQNES